MREHRAARQTGPTDPVRLPMGGWVNREAERERRRRRIELSLLLADSTAERHGIYPNRKGKS